MTAYNGFIPNGKTAVVLAAAWLCLVFSPALPCFGQQPSEPMLDPDGGKISITSDRMIMKTEENTAEFIGDVHAVQGKTSVRSKRLKIFYRSGETSGMREGGMDEDAIERIEALGEVTIDSEDTTATAETAVYTSENGLLKLSGLPASLEQRDNIITGRKITMNRKTGEVEVRSDKDSQVEAVFNPASEPGSEKTGEPGSGRRIDKK